jgi:LPXTG-motif cell wall-anchored protein
LQSAVTGLVNTVTTRFVRSDAFQTLWVQVNRLAHEDIVYVLTGSRPPGSALTFKHGRIQLDLSVIVKKVKDKLVAAGLTVAKNVPVVGATIEIADLKGLDTARKLTRTINRLADWLPWIGLALTAGGIALARKRRRALVSAALGLGAGMLVIGIGLLVARNIFLGAVPTDRLPRDTAQFLFDTIVRFLRLGIRLVFLLALLIAFGAWVSGQSKAATALRRTAASLPRRLGGKVATGPVGPFVLRYTTALRVGVVGLGLVVLFLIDGPSLGTIIVLAVLVLVLLLVIEVLRASEREALRHTPVAG